ncbi:MAG: hypothetical protein N3A02_00535 [Rectinema sp.]|nr:hypothetical protein [Rectinema sp.]
MAENISRSITNQEIQGTPQRELYHDKNTNTLFVWVYVDREATKRIADAIAAKTRGEMEKRAHFAAKVEAEKAFAEFNRLIGEALGEEKQGEKPALTCEEDDDIGNTVTPELEELIRKIRAERKRK